MTSIGNTDILTAEVLTIRETVIHARKSNFSKVIIESDSLMAIRTLNGSITPLYFMGNLVKDINNLFHIENISFYFCHRSTNQAVDRMVKLASHYCMQSGIVVFLVMIKKRKKKEYN